MGNINNHVIKNILCIVILKPLDRIFSMHLLQIKSFSAKNDIYIQCNLDFFCVYNCFSKNNYL